MSTEIVEQARASSISIITNDNYMDRVMSLAKMMASSKVTVPKHLQGSEGDCSAIIMQAMNWGLDPFVVAQKTHLVNGVLGYEAQLVNAVVQSSNSIKGAFSYEYKDEGGTAPNAFVSCRVGAVLNGQKDITWGEWLASASVTTKNSPLWKTNVKQQMAYLQVKNWARMYCPGAILGVYTAEELQDMPSEKDITPAQEPASAKTDPAEIPMLGEEGFKNLAIKYRDSVASGKKTPDAYIAWVESKNLKMTDAQKAEVASWTVKKPDVVEGEATTVTDDFTSAYEQAESENA